MDEHGALSATLVTREGEVEGVLVLPRGARTQPMSLEELRAVKRLADAFSGALEAKGALGRSLERERAAAKRAEKLEETLFHREAHERRLRERDRRVTSRVAEPAEAGPYAPGARVAFETIERRFRAGAPVALLARPGSNPLPYLARAHLAGPRGGGPLVVVAGTLLAEHDVERWADPARSPLALAERGLLVLEDAVRLPGDVQRLIAGALLMRRAPWYGDDAIDVAVAIIAVGSAAEARALLDPALAARFDEALGEPAEWPPLRERGEDLRSLVLDGLAREGMRLRGSPLGIEDAAFERLADYPFPGEDAELGWILQRLALASEGDVVKVVEVEKLRLG